MHVTRQGEMHGGERGFNVTYEGTSGLCICAAASL